MGFVRRLNSKELVGDPCAGAEVYPITATNAVYREGGENLEDILSRLGNQVDRKVVQDISYVSNGNKLQKEFTDNTTEDITLPNWIKNVTVTNSGRTYTITVTPTTGNASTYQIVLPEIDNSNQKISTKDANSQLVSFGENATVELIAGDNVGILPDVTNNTITISSDKETLSCYDFTVTNLNELKAAVARSLGWTAYEVTHPTTSRSLNYMCSTKSSAPGVLTRIHFGSNFGNENENLILNLSYATIYGYDYNIDLMTMKINSPTCTFSRIKFRFTEPESGSVDRITVDTPSATGTHFKYNFEDCQFNRVSFGNAGVATFIKVNQIANTSTVSLKLKYSMFGCEGESTAGSNNYANIEFYTSSQSSQGTVNVILISTISPDSSNDSNTLNKFHVKYTSTLRKCTLTFDSSSKINYYSDGTNTFDPSTSTIPSSITNCIVNKLY